VGRTQMMLGVMRRVGGGHFEKARCCVHHTMFCIDINNGAAIMAWLSTVHHHPYVLRHVLIVDRRLLHVRTFVCEMCTSYICCRVGCAPPVHRSVAALAAVALAAVARTEMATAALGLVRGGPSSARANVVVLSLFGCF
jgi:hypothetical protein